MKALEQITDTLSRFYGFPGVDDEEKFKRKLSLYGAFLVFPALLSFGFFHLSRGNAFLGWYLVMAGVCIGVAAFFVGYFSNVYTLAGTNLVFAGSLFIYLLATSGPHGYMALWLFIYPVAVFFMLGLGYGSLFNGVFLTAVTFVLIFQDSFPSLVPLDTDFKIRFFISFFIVTMLSFAYEMTRIKYEKGVEERGLKLEEEKKNLLEAKKTAEQSNRAKSEFLANMSHELRTPLNHIIGFTEMVTDKSVGPLNSTQEEFLNDALGSSRHLLSLINDILDLSKVEAGKMELETVEFPLETLLHNSLNMVKEKAMKHRIRLELQIHEIPATTRADERKLKQILYNLLSNAVKFTPEGGKVELVAQGFDGQGIGITVSDSGIGLIKSDLDRIFKPFEQGDNSAGRKYDGTGLGLSLTQRLVELHGGRIWAESEGIGKGSHFHVLLPQQVERNPGRIEIDLSSVSVS